MGIRNVTWLLAAAGCVLVLAGCGAGSSGPHVAQLGSSGAPGTASGSAAPNALAYSQCMRAHGVANFPDPNSRGSYDLRGRAGINRDSPQFQSAAQACRSLRPPGIAQEVIADEAQLLKFSACMRAHGEPKFPDITAGSTRRSVVGAIKALSPSSPQFQSALNACRSLLPANLANLGVGGS